MDTEELVSLLTRGTAWISGGLFMVYLATHAGVTVFPRSVDWLREQRRNLLLAFVIAHTVHFGFVVTLAVVTQGASIASRGGWVFAVTTGIGFYVVVLVIWLGHPPDSGVDPPVRRWMQVVSVFLITAVFTQAFVFRALGSPAFLVLALGLPLTFLGYLVNLRRK